MAPAIDTSTPAYVTAGGSVVTTLTTASFTPPTGALLAVLYSNGDNTLVLQSQPSNTGGTVSWDAAAAVSLAAQGSGASIWFGSVTSGASMTVTAHISAGNSNWSMGVAVITGQAASPKGATGTGSSAGGAPTCSLTTSAANSLILAAVGDNSNSFTNPTPGTNQTITFNGNSFNDTSAGRAGWAQYNTSTTIASGTVVTMNDTAPSIQYAMVAVEVLAAGGSTASIPDLIMAPMVAG